MTYDIRIPWEAIYRGPRCFECSHTRWHHAGLRAPGCTYLGSCECVQFRAIETEAA